MLIEAMYRNFIFLYGYGIKSLKKTTAYLTSIFLKVSYNYKMLLGSECHRGSYCLPGKWLLILLQESATKIRIKQSGMEAATPALLL